jgi:hypothetical protein
MATSADDGAAGTGACGQILGSHNHTVQGCASAALARVQAAAGRQRCSDLSPMVKIIIQCATVACDTPCVAQSKGGAVRPPALRRRPAIHTQFTAQMLLTLATASCPLYQLYIQQTRDTGCIMHMQCVFHCIQHLGRRRGRRSGVGVGRKMQRISIYVSATCAPCCSCSVRCMPTA